MRFVLFIEMITYRWPSWWWKEHEKTNNILLSKDAAFLKLTRTRVHYYIKSKGLHQDTACYFAGFSIRSPLQCHRRFDWPGYWAFWFLSHFWHYLVWVPQFMKGYNNLQVIVRTTLISGVNNYKFFIYEISIINKRTLSFSAHGVIKEQSL